MTAADIVASCDGSLRRLQTDVIDLYQIHWPERHVPAFRRDLFRPGQGQAGDLHPRAARSPGLAGQGRQGARTSACPTKRRTACTSSCAWPSSTACRAWPRPEPVLPDQPHARKRRWTKPAPAGRVAAGLFAAGLRPADRQVRRNRHRTGPDAPKGRMARFESCASSAGAAPRRWWPRAATTRWRAPRPDAHAAGAGLLLHQVAGGQHHHRRDLAGPAGRRPGRLGHHAVARAAGAIDAIRWELRDPAQ
jgi:hypothetical protein